MSRMCLCVFVTAIVLHSLSAQAQHLQIGDDIDGEAEGDKSGWSVSLNTDGSVVAIGAPDNSLFAGHVRVYENQSGVWTQIGDDIDGEDAFDESGTSVSLSGNGSVVAIGAPFNSGNGSLAGHVRVFENQSGVWTQIGSDIDGEASNDESGGSVSLSADGSRVAIGARNNDGTGSNAGHVRIYENQSGVWTQIGGDLDGEAAGDGFGWSVDLSADGSAVAVGADFNDGAGTDAGHVRVFLKLFDNWTQFGSDIDGEFAFDYSGSSVSLSANGMVVAIGARGNWGGTSDAGHVRVYGFQSGDWTQIGDDIDGEAADDRSGWSVSLNADGSVVAIGAYLNDGTAPDAGHVRIYQNQSGTWTQIGDDIDGEAAGDESGWSVGLNAYGTVAAIGAKMNDGSGEDAGHVRVYALDIVTGLVFADGFESGDTGAWSG